MSGIRRIHLLKVDPALWPDLDSGRKRAELRRDDRAFPFAVGDILLLRRHVDGSFRGQTLPREVTHVLPGGHYGLAEGWVMLSLGQVGIDAWQHSVTDAWHRVAEVMEQNGSIVL